MHTRGAHGGTPLPLILTRVHPIHRVRAAFTRTTSQSVNTPPHRRALIHHSHERSNYNGDVLARLRAHITTERIHGIVGDAHRVVSDRCRVVAQPGPLAVQIPSAPPPTTQTDTHVRQPRSRTSQPPPARASPEQAARSIHLHGAQHAIVRLFLPARPVVAAHDNHQLVLVSDATAPRARGGQVAHLVPTFLRAASHQRPVVRSNRTP